MSIWIYNDNSISFFVLFSIFIAVYVSGAYIQSCNREGMYMVSYDNGSWECKPCSVCSKGSKISQPCRYNMDTVCEECPSDTFVTKNMDECQPCRECQPGFYVHKECRRGRNRVCKPCADRYFSRNINSLVCYRCRRCKEGERILGYCNKSNNTYCGECDDGYYREASTRDCMPCSECQGEGFVRVQECIQKMGTHSSTICQPQRMYNWRKSSAIPQITTSKQQERRDTPIDVLILAIPVVSIVTPFTLLLVCIAWLFNRLKNQNICCKSLFALIANSTKSKENSPKATVKLKILTDSNSNENNEEDRTSCLQSLLESRSSGIEVSAV